MLKNKQKFWAIKGINSMFIDTNTSQLSRLFTFIVLFGLNTVCTRGVLNLKRILKCIKLKRIKERFHLVHYVVYLVMFLLIHFVIRLI